jgi:biopolymer transport protein ExbD
MRRNVSYVWVDNSGKIYIDDNVISGNMVSSRMAPKIWENPELITIMNIDESVDYGTVDLILDQLKDAKAFRITFATEFGRS